jgi:hypothetical protein
MTRITNRLHNRRIRRVLAVSAALVLAESAVGLASTYNYTTATNGGNWNVAASWTLAGGSTNAVPANGDTAILGGLASTSANFNMSYTGTGLAALTINAFTLNQSTAGTTMAAVNEAIGSTSSGGSYVQNAGANSAGTLAMAATSGSNNNTYSLIGAGTLSAGLEQIGYAGTAVLTQTAGVSTVTGTLSLGTLSTGNGSYTLNALTTGTGTLTAVTENIGDAGIGVFLQNAGTNTASGPVIVGSASTSNGTYTLGGTGSLSAASSETVGLNGTGNFNQTGGTNTMTGSVGAGLYIGKSNGSTGTYNLSGTGSILFANNEFVGNSGTGILNQTGGTNTVESATNGLIIAGTSNLTGTYVLSGTGSLTAGNELVGFGGTGIFNQTGGTNSIPASNNAALTIGCGSTGTYTLSGTGSLSCAVTEYVGFSGTGILTQTGGTNTISNPNYLDVGYIPGSTGTYSLSGTGSLSVKNGEAVGVMGTGYFNQTGGTNVSGDLGLGEDFGSTGTYTLSGTGSISASGVECVGFDGTGIFNQTGGTNTLSSGTSLNIGLFTGSTGTYTLSGGAASVGNNIYVGGSSSGIGGTGVLNVSGSGLLNVAGTLVAYGTPGTSINLSGGVINTAALNFNGVPSLLNWTGGTLNLTAGVSFDPVAAATSTSAAFGTSLSLGTNQTLLVTGYEYIGGVGPFSLTLNSGSSHYVNGTVYLNPSGVLTQNSGSTLFANTFVQAGGTVNGVLQNQGYFMYESGQFNGRLLNQGSLSLGPSFTAGNGVENDNSMYISTGALLTVNGLGLDNLGSLSLSGGTISGSGPVLNDYAGTMGGYGTINSTFTNDGLLTLSGVLRLNGSGNVNANFLQGNGTILGNFTNSGSGTVLVYSNTLMAINSAWTNSGLIEMAGAGGSLNGGTITNTSTIEGAGQINSPVINTGTIRAGTGELILGGAGGTNGATAQIQAGTGGTVLYMQGLASNSGVIALTGGAFDNNNHPITNASTGYISGWGTFRSGGLTNNGFLYAGGNFNAFGPVANGATGAINATGTGLNAFFGPVTNSAGGSFTVQSGANVTFFNSYTGTSPVSNNGTVTFAGSSTSGAITGAGQTVVGDGSPTTVQLIPSGGTSSQASLIFNNGSTLDITNNNLNINYGAAADPVATIRGYLKTAYKGGIWTGPGLTSSSVAAEVARTIAAHAGGVYGIGYVDGGLDKNQAANAIVKAVGNQIVYTAALIGDANLDGSVTFIDLGIVAQNLGAINSDWEHGDFNYDGTTNFLDIGLLAQNLNKTILNTPLDEIIPDPSAALTAQWNLAVAELQANQTQPTNLPEPGMIGLMMVGVGGLLSRRRRR